MSQMYRGIFRNIRMEEASEEDISDVKMCLEYYLLREAAKKGLLLMSGPLRLIPPPPNLMAVETLEKKVKKI